MLIISRLHHYCDMDVLIFKDPASLSLLSLISLSCSPHSVSPLPSIPCGEMKAAACLSPSFSSAFPFPSSSLCLHVVASCYAKKPATALLFPTCFLLDFSLLLFCEVWVSSAVLYLLLHFPVLAPLFFSSPFLSQTVWAQRIEPITSFYPLHCHLLSLHSCLSFISLPYLAALDFFFFFHWFLPLYSPGTQLNFFLYFFCVL